MAGLLAADVGAAALHLLVHVAVADLGLDDVDAAGAQGLVQSEIGHDRRDHDVALESPAALQVTGGDGERVVAVADLALVVDGHETVAVAVEREADLRAHRAELPLERLRVQRARRGIDVGAGGPAADAHDVRAEAAEHPGRHAKRRAVCAVDRDRHAAEVDGEAAAQIVDVVTLGAIVRHVAADAGPARPRRVVGALEPGLDLVLPGVGKLRALGREELDPVVGERIVGGGEHDAAVGVEATGDQRDSGRRQHAGGEALSARAQHARRHRRFEQRPGASRVTADDELDAVAAPLRAQRGHELTADAIGEIGREGLFVGDAADAIGAEQSRHGFPPRCMAVSGRISTVTCTRPARIG